MPADGWTRRKERTRGDVLAAVGEIVREEGLDGLTMRKLAARAGVAVATLYNQFGDRQGVIVAFVADGIERLEHELDAQPAHGPLRTTWALFETFDSVVSSAPDVWRPILSTLRVGRWASGLGPLGDRLVQMIEHDIAKAQAAGMLVIDVDANRLARHVMVTRQHRLEKWAAEVIPWETYQETANLALHVTFAAVLADPQARVDALRDAGIARW